MERHIINPWAWQDNYGFVQANEVSGHQRVLICSGQTSVNADGEVVHAGDMAAQITQALDNLEAVVTQAGFTLADVMKLNYYTTDVDAFMAAGEVLGTRLGMGGCQAAGTLLGVTRLAFPGLMVELEATAVK